MPDAINREGIKRVGLNGDRLRARWCVGDEFGDHRIVIDRDFTAFIHTRIVANGDAVLYAFRRWAIDREAACRGHEIARWIFGIDAGFDRPAIEFDVGLLEAEGFAIGRADHLLNEIDAGDEFRDRMLDLQAGVHLQKEKALVLACDELDRAGRIVIHGLSERHCLLAHFLPRGFIE